jgi:hypothetical protein
MYFTKPGATFVDRGARFEVATDAIPNRIKTVIAHAAGAVNVVPAIFRHRQTMNPAPTIARVIPTRAVALIWIF